MTAEIDAQLTDSGEATDGPLPLDHFVIAYERMRFFTDSGQATERMRSFDPLLIPLIL